MTKHTLRCVGQDDGHDTIKTCFGYDQATNSYLYGYHKSRAVEGLQQILSVGDKTGVAYETEGKQFTVANGQALIRTLDTRVLDYPTSDLNRILVNHALADCKLAGAPLYLVTGLPVDQYYSGREPNKDLIGKKITSLAKPVKRIGNGAGLATIAKQGVVSEAIAAFYDALINHDGSFDSEIEALISRRPVAVVDLGGKTLDIAVVVENVGGVYGERSGTENLGVLGLITKVGATLKAEFKLNNDPPASYVEEAFRTKKYDLFGETRDVSNIIEQACKDYLAGVRNFFLTKVGDGSDLGAVLFVGGGTALLRLALGDEAFSSVYKGKRLVADEPEYANARGMWKYATFVVPGESKTMPASAAVGVSAETAAA